MRGRPSIYDNKEVLQKAQQVFWAKGFTATSLEDILTATGLGSGSFYHAFKGGKKELFRKAIQQRREAFQEFRGELERSKAPVELIKDFFRSMAKDERQRHLQGCIIVNTVVEMACLDDELGEEAIAILKEVEQMFTATIRKAQQNGTLKNPAKPEILGRYLITLWNGMNVTRRMYPDQKVLSEQIEMQLEIIS